VLIPKSKVLKVLNFTHSTPLRFEHLRPAAGPQAKFTAFTAFTAQGLLHPMLWATLPAAVDGNRNPADISSTDRGRT
jgi:hypothetical protein